MAASSSSFLLSSMNGILSEELTETQRNTIRNIVVNSGEVSNPFSLFPSIDKYLKYTYKEIINKPNESFQLITSKSCYKFFFYKTDDVIYEVVTNLNVTDVYRVTKWQ